MNQHSEGYKLPKVEREKEKRSARILSKNLIKSSTKLPTIKTESHAEAMVKQRITQRQKSEGDDFMTEIENKLKVVF